TPKGIEIGCVDTIRSKAFSNKINQLERSANLLSHISISPSKAERNGIEINKDGRHRTAFELLAYPGMTFERLASIWPELHEIDPTIRQQTEVDARYASYVRRQDSDVAALRKDEAVEIPARFDYATLPSLKAELRQKLDAQRPATLAQAGRIEGMTPAALMLI